MQMLSLDLTTVLSLGCFAFGTLQFCVMSFIDFSMYVVDVWSLVTVVSFKCFAFIMALCSVSFHFPSTSVCTA